MKNVTIIDMKEGNIAEEFSKEKVMLMGSNSKKHKGLSKNMKIVVNGKDGENIGEIEVPYNGYHMRLFLGDFNGDGMDEIMLRGNYDDHASVLVYKYARKEGLKRIFSSKDYSQIYKYEIFYLEGYKIKLTSLSLKEDIIIDISSSGKGCVSSIYNKEGKLITGEKPTISPIVEAYPISSVEEDTYRIFLRQKIMGGAPLNTLAMLESFVYLRDDKIKIIQIQASIAALKEQKVEENTNEASIEELPKKLPEGALKVPLNKFGIKGDDFLELEGSEGDKKSFLSLYSLNNINYIGLFQNKENNTELVDNFNLGEQDILDFLVYSKGGINIILIGFKADERNNRLQMLKVQGEKFLSLNSEELPLYSEVYLEDIKNDGDKELIFWIHEMGEVYEVKIYGIEGENLKITNAYDYIYFNKVVEYYKDLIERNRELSTYLYYLALAQEKIGDYEGAILTIDKALDKEEPYPSSEELRQFKKRLIYA